MAVLTMEINNGRRTTDHEQPAIDHLLSLQKPDGSWEGEMVWCTMILSQYVIVQHLARRHWEDDVRAKIIQHYRVTRTVDGAWGLHPESAGYVFTTTLAYVALRLLGVTKDDPLVVEARRWLHSQPGGVLAIPTWGKFWLAMLGLYGYEGVNPCLPELFLLPTWLPFHPRQYYCHTRYIYLGIAYLYGRRFVGDLGPIRDELRGDLYQQPYEAINFAAYRHTLAESDLYVRPSFFLRQVYNLAAFCDRHHWRWLRRRALDHCLQRILYEQSASRYQGLSPVNGLLNCVALYSSEPDAPARGSQNPSQPQEFIALPPPHTTPATNPPQEPVAISHESEIGYGTTDSGISLPPPSLARRANEPAPSLARRANELTASLAGLEAWKWQDDAEGIRYAGARSHAWDTAFGMQALLAGPELSSAASRAVRSAYSFLARTQLTEELPDWKREGRDPVLGGWCFSDGQHRWPVSDCTAEALVAILQTHARPEVEIAHHERISETRLRQAIEFILRRQNADGGFGTYERRRGGAFLERLNPSEMYGSCMTERSYLECTSSAIKALAHFRADHPAILSAKIDRALHRAVTLLCRQQRDDGSWPGFWGVNFTYAIFHAVHALRAAGMPSSDPRLQKAAAWLIGKQHTDGGWGEHYTGCLHDRFVDRPESQVVQTSWAMLALLEVLPLESKPVRHGIDWLRSHQLADGSWQQQGVTGVFFGTAMLDYRLYASYFPTWALDVHQRHSRPSLLKYTP